MECVVFSVALKGVSIMDVLHADLKNVTTDSALTLFQGKEQNHDSSRVYNTAGWTFNTESEQTSSLVFLPIISIIVLIILSLLRVYRWSRGSSRLKVRGDMECGEEAEVNYDIVNVGDKDFCPVDNCSDEASAYDTISSFQFMENGSAMLLNENHPYHDTVTSYKSLLMQKADGSQYDSVKSYKAFLQKVTQNKDLAVEVKLLENYPIRSKSAEHCDVLEEESSERSGRVTTKILGTIPLNRPAQRDSRFPQTDKKRPRHRKPSGGTVAAAMRKRSASHSASSQVTNPAGSLPSIRYTLSLSSDSEEDNQQSFKLDRKKLWAERKKMSRSVSGGKISKDPNSTLLSTKCGHDSNRALAGMKRVRHFSADNAGHLKKAAVSSNKSGSKSINNEQDFKNTQKVRTPRKTMTETKESAEKQGDESSSENPNSSHSSDTDVPSDAIVSESDDDTKRNTVVSNASDDHTLDNDVFFSLDSGAELLSSAEILENSPKRSLSDTRIQIARAKEEFFKSSVHYTLLPQDSSTEFLDEQNSNLSSVAVQDSSMNILSRDNHSLSNDGRTDLNSPAEDLRRAEKSTVSTNSGNAPPDSMQMSSVGNVIFEAGESNDMPSPHKVQRFHVTFVNADISSHNSE